MRSVSRAAAAVAAVAGIASFTYQQIADARDRRRCLPPGRQVDIGGRRLHLVEMGEGSPAVIIIPALANNVLPWLRVLEAAAADTQVCVYDRAGLGWSDPSARGQSTPGAMAGDLHALLQAAGIPPPYVLVGHSLGGVIARRFQANYPEAVAGVLLIDSSHEDHPRRLGAVDWREGTVGILRSAARRQARVFCAPRLTVALGLTPGFTAEMARTVPPEYVEAARAISLSARQNRAVIRELLVLAHSWGQPDSLGSLPLAVLTASPRPWRGWPVWAQMQDELAALSPDSEHVMACTAGHDMHLDEPDLVVQAIRALVGRCRSV
jgi:pimeloyl-ACP methyl ester carboxylesterase